MKILAGILIAATAAFPALAQTRGRDVSTAYGARLTGKAASTTLNQNRVNSRIENRINNRLSLRVERYRPDTLVNPAAAYQDMQTDKSRTSSTLNIAPPPPAEDPQ